MPDKISGKGLRRVVLAGDTLHVLGDGKRIILQFRTPHLTTSEDAIGPAFKVGVALDRDEALKLVAEVAMMLREGRGGKVKAAGESQAEEAPGNVPLA